MWPCRVRCFYGIDFRAHSLISDSILKLKELSVRTSRVAFFTPQWKRFSIAKAYQAVNVCWKRFAMRPKIPSNATMYSMKWSIWHSRESANLAAKSIRLFSLSTLHCRPHEGDADRIYVQAKQAGEFGVDCAELYASCGPSDGLLESISKLF